MHIMHTNSNNNHILLAVVAIVTTHVESLALFQLISHPMDNTMNIVKVVNHTCPCHYLVDIRIAHRFKQQQQP